MIRKKIKDSIIPVKNGVAIFMLTKSIFLFVSNFFFPPLFQTLKLPENGPIFSNIKQFELTVFPFDDNDNFSWIGYILKAFPLLQKLELNVSMTFILL